MSPALQVDSEWMPTEQPGNPMTVSQYNLFVQQMDIRSMFSFQPW